MQHIYRLIFLCWAIFIAAQQNNNPVFHDTQGNIEVNGSGQLQYTLPIALPPGIKSVAPQINLLYSSGSGNGIAGYGWSLSGLTAITRMGETIEKDGEVGGIQLDYSDYYSFNGQRLILKSGEYGKDGAEYVTEKFSNVKIKSVGALLGVAWKGPAYWEVTFEDGSQAWYGGTGLGVSTARTPNEYNIVKWKDAQGNYITYEYLQADNVSRISRIGWGGNETLNKPHINEIRFAYTSREIQENAYLGGQEYIQRFVLKEVQVLTRGKQFKKYVTQHQSIDGYPRVEQITEYNAQNEMANPVVFSYQSNTLSSDQNTITQGVKDTHTKKYGDFDFDGEVDFLEMEYNGTLSYKKSVYKAGDAIPIQYNRNEFSAENFRRSAIITYKNNNIVGNSAGIVIPVAKGRENGSDVYDYEFRIYAVNLTTNTLDYQYSKTLKYEDFKTIGEPITNIPVGCFVGASSLETLTAYDYDGDGITEVLAEFKFSRSCSHSDNIDLMGMSKKQEEKISHDEDHHHTMQKVQVLLADNTEYYENKNLEQHNETQRPPNELLPQPTFEIKYSTIFFDLKQETPYQNSFYKFNEEYIQNYNNDYDRKRVLQTADFNGDGIDELYLKKDNAFREIVNIKKNTSGNYFLTSVIGDQYIQGLEGNAIIADFNGDGKADLSVPQAQKSSHWKFYFATGKGFKVYDYTNFIYFSSGQDITDEDRHNTFFESGCYGRTITYYQYNAVDLDKDGKAEITVSRSIIRNHDWNAHHDRENTRVTLLVYSVAKPDTTPVAGNTVSPLKYGLTQEKSFYFGGKVIYFNPLFINKTNQQIVLIGRPDDCPTSNCDRTHVIYLDYKNIPTKTRLVGIEQGKLKTDIVYTELLPVGNFYQSMPSLSYYPYMSLNRVKHSYLVSQLKQHTDHGIRKQDFRYRGLTTHLHGKGMLGFRKTARTSWYTDNTKNTMIWSGVETDPLQDGVPVKEWSIKSVDEAFPADLTFNNNQLLSLKITEYRKDILASGIQAMVPIRTLSRDNQTQVVTENTIDAYDSYYLPLRSTTKVNGNFSVTTTNWEYLHNPSGVGRDYFIGRPRSKQETVIAYGDSKGAKEDYEYENHQLKTKTSYNQNNTGWVKDTYTYDGFGNILQTTKSNSVDNLTITERVEYDADGRFVIKKTDNLGLITTLAYNDWGQVLRQTDPFGVETTTAYDAWGKVLNIQSSLGGRTEYVYEKRDGHLTRVVERRADGGETITVKNKVGNTLWVSEKSLGGVMHSNTFFKYDELGREIKRSQPILYPEVIFWIDIVPLPYQWNTTEYDDFSRPIKATAYTGKVVETQYNGLVTTITETNAHGRFKKQTMDALGNVASSEDLGGVIHFKYNALGQNIEAKYGNNTVTTKYDHWGRKVEFNDPSNGIYRYEYNGFGALTKTISPKGYKTYALNDKGQLIAQNEVSNDGHSTQKNIQFEYNTKGQLTKKQGTSKGRAYQTVYTYDTYGRSTSVVETHHGKTFTQDNIEYDHLSRVASYRKSIQSGNQTTAVEVQNVYGQNGTLQEIRDKNSGQTLWKLHQIDAEGKVLSATLGRASVTNSYSPQGFITNMNHSFGTTTFAQVSYDFDAIKNELKSRVTGGDFNILESFEYDHQNRLVNWTDPVTGHFAQNAKRNVYDAQGRITYNDDLGAVQFAHPQSVYRPSGVTLNTQGEQNLANNLIQHIQYNENNDPISIDGTKGDVSFFYGLSNMRQVMNYGANFLSSTLSRYTPMEFTKYYSEDGSFEIVRDNSKKREKHIIYIGGSPYESEIVYLKNFNETTGSYKFLHKDYLGSILAISDEAGNKVEQRHYDAWGNLTHLQIGSGGIITDKELIANSQLLIARGYTSHEHLLKVGLIHMNGRLYDPLLRRFLNADEHIQDPYNTQNYNKYGYVYNNPLMYNDPSGELIPIVAAIAIGAAVGLASYTIALGVTGNIHNWNLFDAFKATFFGAIGGAVTFGVGEIFNVASQAGRLTQIGTLIQKSVGDFGLAIVQAGTHAVAQGVLSVFQGEGFRQAFWSGALGSLGASGFQAVAGKFAKSTIGTIAFGALSGGIGAELSDGNFWEGAVIGGIVAGLNHAMHKINFDPPREILVRHYDAKYSAEEGKWILSVKSDGYQMVNIAGASDGYQVINIYNSEGYVVGTLQGNDAYHTFNTATKGKFVDTHNTIIRGKSTVTLGEFLEYTGKGIRSGSVAASPFTKGWSLAGVPVGKFVSFTGTATKYYGYWMYRNYGGYKDGIQGTIIDAAVGNTLRKINRR